MSHVWKTHEVDFFVALFRNYECLWKRKSHKPHSVRIDRAFADIQSRMLKYKNVSLTIEFVKETTSNVKCMLKFLNEEYGKLSPENPSKEKWYKDMVYIIQNTKNYLDLERFENTLHGMGQDVVPSTSSSVKDLLTLKESEKETSILIDEDRPLASSTDHDARIAILNVLKKVYTDTSHSNHIDELYKILQDADHSSDTKMQLKTLGFINKLTNKGSLVIEKAKQRFERYVYLTKIRKARNAPNRQIVYIDERIVNYKLEFPKVHNLVSLPSRSSVYFHAFTRDGVLNGLFSNQASEEDFSSWIVNILLIHLKRPCLVIMDNGPIHGVLEDDITRYSTKSDMLKWLNDNNIPYGASMLRPELYELIRRKKTDDRQYRIDRIFKAHGHEVLRLPSTFPDLNLTNLFWNGLREMNLANALAQSSNVKLQCKISESILPSISKKEWLDLEKLLIAKENEIFLIDTEIEECLETYVRILN